ncbi:HNH endonuclease [Fusobacterium nucleatum]|uniref:HNH endonuclease n=1 Tax=Fusobacterium nucleatum TaxID=851 RepID=UPI00355B7885
MTEEEIKKKLLEIFPDKILKDFSKKIPYELKKELKKILPNGKKLKEFIINRYNFIDKNFRTLDYKIIDKLEKEYIDGNYKRKIFEKTEKITKQRVEQKIKKALQRKSDENWEVETLNTLENEAFYKLITKREEELETNDLFIFIFRNGKECILLIYDKVNKMYKTISKQENNYIKELLKNDFHKYGKEDFINMKYLKKINKNNKVQVTGKELENSDNKQKMKIEKYVKFLGFEYIHPNKNYTDEDIKKILERHIYPNTKKDVYLPTDSEDANLLRTIASRYDDGIEELVNRLGFNYHIRDTYLRIIETFKYIEKKYNGTWIPFTGKFYNNLYRIAQKKGYLLEEYIKDMGFKIEKNKLKTIKISDEKYDDEIYKYYNSLKNERKVNKIEIDEESLEFIKGIDNEVAELIKPNEKEAIVKQRLTQGLFKEKLIKRECKCTICNIKNKLFLIASHIKPWVDSNDYEKIDVNNGFLFCPNHDKLFDEGYISFKDSGEVIISPKLTKKDIELFNLSEKITVKISKDAKKYLEYHRKECFKEY